MLLQAGQKPEAHRLLTAYLQVNPASAHAWWLMSQAAADPLQKADCLERVLQLDPGNVPALEQLEALKSVAGEPPNSPPSTPANAPNQGLKDGSVESEPPAYSPTPVLAALPQPASKKTVLAPPHVPSVSPRSKPDRASQPARKPRKSRIWILDALMGIFVICALSIAGFYFWQMQKTRATISHQQTQAVAALLTNLPTSTFTFTPTRSLTRTATATRTNTPTASVTPTFPNTPTREARPVVHYTAPDFILTDLATGEKIALNQFAGRPVLVVFWATWCPHCLSEMQALNNLHQDFADQNLEILAINIGENQSAVSSYQTKNKLAFQILLDPKKSITNKYKVTGVPTHFFIDSNGVIFFIQVGGLPYSILAAQVKAMIE